jgi:DNA polymerase-3 subunit alpha
LKGVGSGPVEAVLQQRATGVPFTNVFDMMRRLDLSSFNKRCLDSLVLGGGLDGFKEMKRWHYYAPSEKYDTFIEHLLRYGNAYQSQKAQSVNSLFGDSDEILIPEPKVPEAREWSLIEKLTKEKEVTGIYISGHPLDDYKLEIENYTTCTLEDLENHKGGNLNLAGVVIAANNRIDKKGNGYGFFTIQDYNGSLELALWRDDYNDYAARMKPGEVVFIKGKYEYNNYREEYQFKVQEIQQLAAIGLKMTESITLKLQVQKITDDLIDEIEDICKHSKGKLPLKIEVIEPDNQIKLKFRSVSRKVNVDGEMIAKLERIGVKYKLNA